MSSKKNLPFTREDLKKADVKLLRDGRWGNACVSVAEVNGERWTIKDFSNRHWLVKNSFAKLVLWRELKAIKKLAGLEGVPNKAFMLDDYTLAVQYIPGRVLARVPEGEVTAEYLEQCEAIINAIHQRDLVHLDTRGTSNWVMTPDGKPALIDFQQSGFTRAVQTEHADLGSGEKRQRNVFQNLSFGRNNLSDPVHGVNKLCHI